MKKNHESCVDKTESSGQSDTESDSSSDLDKKVGGLFTLGVGMIVLYIILSLVFCIARWACIFYFAKKFCCGSNTQEV